MTIGTRGCQTDSGKELSGCHLILQGIECFSFVRGNDAGPGRVRAGPASAPEGDLEE